MDAYRAARAPYETTIINRLIGAIEQAMHGYEIKGVTCNSVTLRPGRSRLTEETRYGADFLGLFNVDLSDSHVKQAFKHRQDGVHSAECLAAMNGPVWSRKAKQC